jgi:hypothetical protein
VIICEAVNNFLTLNAQLCSQNIVYFISCLITPGHLSPILHDTVCSQIFFFPYFQISKSNVVDDMVNSNRILYGPNEKPDHCVVIKHVPYVGKLLRIVSHLCSLETEKYESTKFKIKGNNSQNGKQNMHAHCVFVLLLLNYWTTFSDSLLRFYIIMFSCKFI